MWLRLSDYEFISYNGFSVATFVIYTNMNSILHVFEFRKHYRFKSEISAIVLNLTPAARIVSTSNKPNKKRVFSLQICVNGTCYTCVIFWVCLSLAYTRSSLAVYLYSWMCVFLCVCVCSCGCHDAQARPCFQVTRAHIALLSYCRRLSAELPSSATPYKRTHIQLIWHARGKYNILHAHHLSKTLRTMSTRRCEHNRLDDLMMTNNE